MRKVARSKLFEFCDEVAVGKSGFYKAKILYKGNIVKENATFFPSDWSREKVIKVIFDSCEEFVKSGKKLEIGRDGKYVLDVLFEEEVKIRIHITRNGLIKSAYPLFE